MTDIQAGNDGWIEWRGGVCPVLPGPVDVRYRDGEKIGRFNNLTELGERSPIWAHDSANPECDIVAYRLVQS